MMNWKGFGRTRSWPNWRFYSCIHQEGLTKHRKISLENDRLWGQDLNPRLPECEAGVLTTRPLRSVLLMKHSLGATVSEEHTHCFHLHLHRLENLRSHKVIYLVFVSDWPWLRMTGFDSTGCLLTPHYVHMGLGTNTASSPMGVDDCRGL
jgi:hypothetical protein